MIDFGTFSIVGIDWANNIVKLQSTESYEFKCEIAAPRLDDDELRKLGANLGKIIRLSLEILPNENG